MEKTKKRIFSLVLAFLFIAMNMVGVVALTSYNYGNEIAYIGNSGTDIQAQQTAKSTAVIFANPHFGQTITNMTVSFAAWMGEEARYKAFGSNDCVNWTLITNQYNPSFGAVIYCGAVPSYTYYKFTSEPMMPDLYSLYVGIPDNTRFFAVNGMVTSAVSVDMTIA